MAKELLLREHYFQWHPPRSTGERVKCSAVPAVVVVMVDGYKPFDYASVEWSTKLNFHIPQKYYMDHKAIAREIAKHNS